MNIQHLETQYLKAKLAYYTGTPIMSDAAFDVLESELKAAGSKVVEQVGSKRKDFDFPHPTPMKSLAKIQTETANGVTNYQETVFMQWFQKRENHINQINGTIKEIYYSPKFDGSAINIIYRDGKLESVLTRGDGKYGKDCTDRFRKHLPVEIGLKLSVVEIRCECVMRKSTFERKYAKEFANARNIVAGIIGKDDIDFDKVADLTLVPLAILADGKHMDLTHARNFYITNPIFSKIYSNKINPTKGDYIHAVKELELLREKNEFQLDGIVFALPIQFREYLGENDHDPEWAIAIKFVPDEVVTKVNGVEWSISKTGELNPVVLLKPVELAGTIVKRASGYNAGYIVNNKIGPDTFVSIAKAGDIIPEIQSITVQSDSSFDLPTYCPYCNSTLGFDGIHLTCPNDNCVGKIAKKLASASTAIDLKGVGGKTLEPFARDHKNLYEVIKYVYVFGKEKSIEQYGIIHNSRSHEIFLKAFHNIKSLTYEQVIVMLGFDNVGKKLSLQIAREHAGLPADYTGLEKALVAMLHEPQIEAYIKRAVTTLEALGIVIDKPKPEVANSNTVYVCMTGSPKDFGFKTKEDFIKQFPNAVETSLSDKRCSYLITDSYSSTSGKMKEANKKGITIKTYADFKI